MGRVSIISLVAVLSATGAYSEVTPDDIAWGENGSIVQPLTEVPGDAEEGKVVMTTNALGNCVACHTIAAMPDVPFQGTIAPELQGVGNRWTEAELRGIVVDAKRVFPDSFMPGMYKVGPFIRPGVEFTGKAPETPEEIKPILTAQQVEDVVAYLMTLKE